jgi:phosphocarrier protein HPr
VSTVRRTVTIVNPRGLHVRASRLFVETAGGFAATVTVRRDDLEVSADSVLSMLELVAGPGSQLEIVAEGEDAEAAIDALAELVAAGFHED